jgi:hypothetical protein
MAKQAFVWSLHNVRGTHSAGNDMAGFQALLAALKGRRIGLITIEATGGLERELASFLLQHGLPVAVVNPRAAREFARSMGHLASLLASLGGCLKTPKPIRRATAWACSSAPMQDPWRSLAAPPALSLRSSPTRVASCLSVQPCCVPVKPMS